MDEKIKNVLDRLSKSKFRSGFHLKDKDMLYIKDKGVDKIREHAYVLYLRELLILLMLLMENRLQ